MPRSSHLALTDGHPKRPTKQGWLLWGRLLGCLLGLLFVFVVRGIGVVTAHTHDLSCFLTNQESDKGASADRPVQGSAVAPHNGVVFFHPWVWSDFHICSAASFLKYRRSLSNGGPSGIDRPRSMKTFGSLTQAELSTLKCSQ